MQLQVPRALPQPHMPIEQVYCRASEWHPVHVIALHVENLDAKPRQWGQVFDLERESQCLVHLVPVLRASVQLGAPRVITVDQLDFDVDLEAEIVQRMVETHLCRCTLCSLRHRI